MECYVQPGSLPKAIHSASLNKAERFQNCPPWTSASPFNSSSHGPKSSWRYNTPSMLPNGEHVSQSAPAGAFRVRCSAAKAEIESLKISDRESSSVIGDLPKGEFASDSKLKNGSTIGGLNDSSTVDALLEERRQSSDQVSTSGRFESATADVEFTKAMQLIESNSHTLTVEQLSSSFKFPLDGFQKQAINEFVDGHSVLVCAPTGAGKTAIAEAATIATLAKGLRVIYTTPLKALSNQKLTEMREQFGHKSVGLQTGDVSLNAEGSIVVMTTEVLRNMLYRPSSLAQDDADSDSNSDSGTDRLADVGLVVLDEVHYLGNPERGSVWEEAIISCHKHIPLLCMSATVANPEDLGGWITKVHGSCKTIVTDYRPVPLYWSFCQSRSGITHIGPLLDESGYLHPRLQDTDSEESIDDDLESFGRSRGRKSRGNLRPQVLGKMAPAIEDCLNSLKKMDLLPAIWFAFSRVGCDTSALQMHAQRVELVTKEEALRISEAIEELRAEQPEAIREKMVGPLLRGVASHHAGCLPAWKSLVERLYQQGVIKVVFATGTLAAGVNMPARSTVISTTTRRAQNGHISLPHNELLQMAGRAGRRGYDVEGHCIFLQDAYTQAGSIVNILRAGPEPLQSHFATGYGMVLKLLNKRKLEYARNFVQRSFYNYLAEEGTKVRKDTIESLLRQVEDLQARADESAPKLDASDPEDVFAEYLRAKDEYQEKRKEYRRAFTAMLRQRATTAVLSIERKALPVAVGIEVESFDKTGQILPALIVASERSGFRFETNASYLCLTSDNRLMQIAATNIAAVGKMKKTWTTSRAMPILSAAKSIFSWQQVKPAVFQAQGSGKTARLAANLLEMDLDPIRFPEGVHSEVKRLQEEMKVVKIKAEKLQRSASGRQTERPDLQLRAEATRLKRRARQIKDDIKRDSKEDGLTWRSFENTLKVLVKAGALEDKTYHSTDLGAVARELNADNELWLATVLQDPALLNLPVETFAGVICAFVAGESNLRSNLSVRYGCSREVTDIIESLEMKREALYRLQASYGVNASLGIDLRLSGIAEAWAAGAAWEHITGDCTMDGGDIARILSRTVDILRQISFCTALPATLRASAKNTLECMARKPITDMIT